MYTAPLRHGKGISAVKWLLAMKLYTNRPSTELSIELMSFHSAPYSLHLTEASSLCEQSWFRQPPWEQSTRRASVPTQSTESSMMSPVPLPNSALSMASPPMNPNWRHTTAASATSHLKGQSISQWCLRSLWELLCVLFIHISHFSLEMEASCQMILKDVDKTCCCATTIKCKPCA